MSAIMPEWAQAIQPIIGVSQAAKVLGVSERKLNEILQEHPYYERRGRSYAFYPEHIEKLRTVECHSRKRSTRMASITQPAPLPADAYAKALELATKGKQKKRALS
jgi:phage antirepressor YoqD-like protein